MSISYDYVQIVNDDTWGLVGIVPNNNSLNSQKVTSKDDIYPKTTVSYTEINNLATLGTNLEKQNNSSEIKLPDLVSKHVLSSPEINISSKSQKLIDLNTLDLFSHHNSILKSYQITNNTEQQTHKKKLNNQQNYSLNILGTISSDSILQGLTQNFKHHIPEIPTSLHQQFDHTLSFKQKDNFLVGLGH